MHGNGARRICPTCGQSVGHITDILSHRELRGPRQITSSNIDRAFDDNGRRALIAEEKQPKEATQDGQLRLLHMLANLPEITVWGVRGTPDQLRITDLSTRSTVAEGDWNAYQEAVTKWYASDDGPRWEARLDAIAEMPFDPPPWVPAEVWREFDKALTRVLAHKPGS